ncbi:DUF998 domain-containing protein [Amycolatopsis jejuensis]|uniref:DUF998 domain-containing protein n=1 Tax=Amycolatopsis jejuensis TaxID=330084 RepID=UPI0009FEA442|nr:DUF998 domain-containing protein [Amycolatopsis jejuensis]
MSSVPVVSMLAVVTLIPRKDLATAPALAGAGLVLSLLPIAVLHLVAAGAVSPVRDVISDYVFAPGGVALLAFSSLGLAGASLVLRSGLVARGLPKRGPEAVLLTLWAAGLVVATFFPTDPTGIPTSFSGAVHRYAGLAMFVCLPLAGWLLGRRYPAATAVRHLSAASGAASFAFLLAHAPLLEQSVPAFLGLFERVLFALLYAQLFAIALVLRREPAEVIP